MDTDAIVFLFVICVFFGGLVGYVAGVGDARKEFATACQHYKAYNTGKLMLICEVKR